MQSLILSRRDIKENDQIISFYTLEKGKLEVLARGVKKITSKNSAHLEPFSFVDLEIISGKGIAYLGAAQPVNYFSNIRRDLQKSLSAGFVMSALDKILHEGEKDQDIFNLILSWLEFVSLQTSESKYQTLLDSFFVKLLILLGFDITELEKASASVKVGLKELSEGNWQAVSKLEYNKQVHNFIYKALVFNTDRKVGDWGKIVNLT